MLKKKNYCNFIFNSHSVIGKHKWMVSLCGYISFEIIQDIFRGIFQFALNL